MVATCPHLGDEGVVAIPTPEFQGVNWLAVRLFIKSAPVISKPGPVDWAGVTMSTWRFVEKQGVNSPVSRRLDKLILDAKRRFGG